MKTTLKTIITLCFITLLSLSPTIATKAVSRSKVEQKDIDMQKPIPGRKIVRFKEGTKEETKNILFDNITADREGALDGLGKDIEIIDATDETLATLQSSTLIEQIEDDYYISALGSEINDPLYQQQWYLPYIAVQTEWNKLSEESEEITIAVIDSGICSDHPDLEGKILEGWDYIDNDNNPEDEFGHGCGVSGLIAAGINNQIGIAGVYPNARIMPLKVLDKNGIGAYSDLAKALIYATDNGADIINMSLGGYIDSEIIREAVSYATSKGVFLVAAAGNTGNNDILYPAKLEGVISVGSIGTEGAISSFSSRNKDINIWAPGENIISTASDGSYRVNNGTSYATALVSGTISLRLANNGNLIFPQNTILYLGEDVGTAPTVTNIKYSTYTDTTYKWSLKHPDTWTAIESIKNNTNDPYVIQKRITLLAPTKEIVAIDVWKNSRNLSVLDALIYHERSVIDMATVPKTPNGQIGGEKAVFVGNLSDEEGNKKSIEVMVNHGKYTYAIIYSISSGIEYESYKEILKSFSFADSKTGKSDISNLPGLRYGLAAQSFFPTCGGYRYEYNQFLCCSATNSNCTWWAIYQRPDLWDKITYGHAGQTWIDLARAAGIQILSSPKVGSIVVWGSHVAYVTGINANGTINITEMNCYGGFTGAKTVYPYSYAPPLLGYIDLQTTISLQYSLPAAQSPLNYTAKNTIILSPGFTTTLGNYIVMGISQ